MESGKIRILYADQHPLDQQLVQDTLLGSGGDYQIVHTSDRSEFLQLLGSDFDLLLSDLDIMGFSGFEILENAQSQAPDLPILVLTSQESEGLAAAAIRHGAVDYAIKTPERIQRLPYLIRRVLEKKSLEQEQGHARAELVESQTRYQRLVNTVQEGIWSLDQHGVTTYVNPSMAKILGYQVEDMLGKHLFEFINPEDRDLSRKHLKQREEGINDRFDFIFLTKEGRKVITNLIASPILDKAGEYQGAVAAIRDITAQKEAEKALQDSRQELAALIDNTPGNIWSVDPEYHLISCNQNFCRDYQRIFGEELQPGQNLLQSIPEEASSEWRDYYQQAFAGETFQIERKRLYTRSVHWEELTFSPIRAEDGLVRAVLVQSRDITDRKQTLTELINNEIKYRTLTEESPAAIFETDASGKCVYVNAKWKEISGQTNRQALGDNWLKAVHPLDRDSVRTSWLKFLQIGGRWIQEYRIKDQVGNTTWVQGEAVPLRNEEGLIRGYLGTNTIISIRKEMEGQLRKVNRTLDALLGNLPGMAFHCLNNPDWEMLFVSEGVRQLTGYATQDLIQGGKVNFADLIHPEDRERVWVEIQAAVELDQRYQIRYRIHTKDQALRWVFEQGIATKWDSAGNAVELEGFIEDITEQELASQALQSTTSTLTTILESLEAQVTVTDLENYQVLYMNQRAVEDFEGSHIGEPCYQAFRGKSQPCSDCTIHKLTDPAGVPIGRQIWEGRNPLSGRWKLNTDRAIRWVDGRPAHLQISVDINDRKLSEDALRESEAKFRSSFENANVGMALVNREGRFTEVNSTIARILDYPAVELIGISFLDVTHPDSQADSLANWQACLAEGKPYSIEKNYLTSKGELVTCLTSISPVFNDAGDFQYAIKHLIDISHEKAVEQEIMAQQQFYNLILSNVQEGIWVTNARERIIYFNPGMERISGAQAEDMLGLSVVEDFPPETSRNLLPFYQQAKDERQPVSYQAEVVTPGGRETIQTGWLVPRYDGGTYQGMICSIQDVTQEKINERALQESERKYRGLFEMMLDGFALHEIVLDRKGKPVDYVFLDVNAAFLEMTDLKETAVIGRPVTEVLPGIEKDPADWIGRYGQVALTGQETRQELYSEPLGKWFSVLAYSPEKGQFATIFRDITARKKTEAALQDSEARYRVLVESSPDGIITAELTGKVLSVNQAFLELTGFQESDFLGKNYLKIPILLHQDLKSYAQILTNILAGKHPNLIEFRWRNAAGEEREGEAKFGLHKVGGKSVLQLIIRDITQRKRFERSLQRSDFIIDSTSDSVIVTDTSGKIIFWNTGAEEIYGYSAEEAKGQQVSLIYRDQDLPKLGEIIADLNRGKTIDTLEIVNLTKDQREITALLTLSTIKDGRGKIAELVGITKDITPIREAEKSIRTLQERTQHYLDVAEVMLLALDQDCKVEAINPKGCQILGYPEEDIVGKDWISHFLDPREAEQVREVFDQILSGNIAPVENYENLVIQANGERRLISWHNALLRDSEGSISGVLSSGEDITDRRQAEIELRLSKETAERYLNIAAEIILSLDIDGTITMLNPSGHQLLGYQDGELIGKNWFETCLPEDIIPEIKGMISTAQRGEMTGLDVVEGRVLTKQGVTKNILWHNSFLRDREGRISGILSSGEDITRQTEILEELTASRQLILNLSQAAQQVQNLQDGWDYYKTIGDGISDLGFNIAIFSYAEEKSKLGLEYLSYGNDLLDRATQLTGIIPTDFEITLHPGGYFKQVVEDQTSRLALVSQQILREALPNLTKSLAGTLTKIFSLQTAIFAPLVSDGKTLGLIVVLGEDLTEEDLPPIALFASQSSTALKNARYAETLRQRTEQLENLTTLISETEEAERKRLSQELHDQVGQSLALLGFNLNQIMDQLQTSPQQDRGKVKDAQQLLTEITSGIRSVMDDLRPAILDDYGLLPALHWYADKISDRSGLKTSVQGENLTPRLDRQAEIALFRITQEALTNITRHSQADKIEIELSEDQGQVTLRIRDDGIGFDPDDVRHREQGGGWGLINIRERASRIGGTLEIHSQPGQGTELIISVPRG